MDSYTTLVRTINANRGVSICMILVLILIGLASRLEAQTPAAGQADQRPFVEGGVLTGGMGPDEMLHRFGASGELAVPVWRDSSRIATLRARIETLSGHDSDDRFVSLLYGLSGRFNPRVALGTVGYAAGWGTWWSAPGGITLGVAVPIALANRLAIVPRVSTMLLLGQDIPSGFLAVATLGINVRVGL